MAELEALAARTAGLLAERTWRQLVKAQRRKAQHIQAAELEEALSEATSPGPTTRPGNKPRRSDQGRRTQGKAPYKISITR